MVKHFSRPWTKPYKPSCARRFFIITAAFVRPGRDCLPLQTTPGRAAEAPYPSPQQRPSAPAEAAASLLSPPPRTCPRTTRPRTPHTQLRGRAPHTHTHTPRGLSAAGPPVLLPPAPREPLAVSGRAAGEGRYLRPARRRSPLSGPAAPSRTTATSTAEPPPRAMTSSQPAPAHTAPTAPTPRNGRWAWPRARFWRGGAGRGGGSGSERSPPRACLRAVPRRAAPARHGTASARPGARPRARPPSLAP